MWKKLRVDFTTPIHCVLCNRNINSGKGIAAVDEEGNAGFLGPNCAEKSEKVSNFNEKIPDLTKGCFEINENEQSSSSISRKNNELLRSLTSDDKKKTEAIEYLLLRHEKLTHIPDVRYQALESAYQEYLRNELSEKNINFIHSLAHNKDKYKKFSIRNLRGIYACDYWLNQFLMHATYHDTSFIQSMLSFLHQNLFLTEKQIIGINNWFKNFNEKKLVRIDPNVFDY